MRLSVTNLAQASVAVVPYLTFVIALALSIVMGVSIKKGKDDERWAKARKPLFITVGLSFFWVPLLLIFGLWAKEFLASRMYGTSAAAWD